MRKLLIGLTVVLGLTTTAAATAESFADWIGREAAQGRVHRWVFRLAKPVSRNDRELAAGAA